MGFRVQSFGEYGQTGFAAQTIQEVDRFTMVGEQFEGDNHTKPSDDAAEDILARMTEEVPARAWV